MLASLNWDIRSIEGLTEDLSIAGVGVNTVYNREGEFAFCEVFCETFIGRKLTEGDEKARISRNQANEDGNVRQNSADSNNRL